MIEIRKNIRSGIFYTALSRYSYVAASILISAALARLLTPEDFGIVALITVFLTFFNLLSRFGFGSAIVQNKDLSDEDISSIFSFTILLGIVIGFIFFLISPLIADFYDKPILTTLSRIMSIAILFNSFQIVPNALITKQLKFKEVGIISVGVYVVTGVIAIILAFWGFSYYALIINGILNSLFLFIAYYHLAPVKPTLKIKLEPIKKIMRFSTFQFLFTFINYFAGNSDNLLIGKYFNATALGFYDKAYKLMLMPVQNLTQVITPVLHPVLSHHQDNKKVIYDTYYKIVKLLAFIGFPLSIFLYFNANEIINIMFGSQWGESIPVFKLLALAVGIQIVLSSTGSIFQATNRTDLLFYSGLLSTTLVIAGIIYGIFIGKDLVSVGLGILIAFSINIFQAFYLLIKISLEESFFNFLKVFYFPIILSIGLFIALWSASHFTVENYVLSLLIKTIVSIFVFGVILISSKENFVFFKEYSKKMFKK